MVQLTITRSACTVTTKEVRLIAEQDGPATGVRVRVGATEATTVWVGVAATAVALVRTRTTVAVEVGGVVSMGDGVNAPPTSGEDVGVLEALDADELRSIGAAVALTAPGVPARIGAT